ncbi:YitT family protein [uncultured Porphyromonas sp.]|uniref:YitT family protein n=1 Tax=uncultured Porphyromonas sp. TaxID=159274 RepID=UPI00260971E6|nr:YitT family protein [uncultured Porphyromonas sp.]
MSQAIAAPTNNRAKAWYFVHDFFFIILGVSLYVLGWTGFILSQEITTGGLAGVTTIIQIATQIPANIPYNIINVGLLVVSIIFLGWRYSVKTLIGVVLMGIAIPIGQALFGDANTEVYHNLSSWLTNTIPNVGPLLQGERFMAVIIGGILCGSGLFLVFHVNGSTGGTDVIVSIFNKYTTLSLGRAMILIDATIVTASYFVNVSLMGKDPQVGAELLTFSIVEVVFCAMTLDYWTNSNKHSIQLFIFSKKYKEINEAIIQRLNRGCTLVHAEGGYSQEETRILMVVTRKAHLQSINRIIKEIDPDAFVSEGTVHGVYGRGFDNLR